MEWHAQRIWKDGTGYNKFLFFRKAFSLDDPSQVIALDAALFAESRYELWVNGRFVGRGPAAFDPRHARYDRYALRNYLVAGENVIGILVCYYGNGCGDHLPRLSPGLVFEGELHRTDGRVETLASDESWRCKHGTCWFPAVTIRSMWRSLIELVDARWYPDGWNRPGYVEGSDWLVPDVMDAQFQSWTRGQPFLPRNIRPLIWFDNERSTAAYAGRVRWLDEPAHVLRSRLMHAVQECPATPGELFLGPKADLALPLHLAPVPTGQATYIVFDFGQAVTGRLGFELEAPAGTVVDIVVKEYGSGQKFQFPIAHVNAWNRYTCRTGLQSWRLFDYDNYRHAELIVHGNDAPVTLHRVWCEEQRYPLDLRGTFECSDVDLNRLWQAAKYTIELTTEDVIVDVASREVGTWSGDCEPAKAAIYYLAGADAITAQGLRNISYSSLPSGRILGEWPSGVPGTLFEGGIITPAGRSGPELPHHSFQWIQSVWRHYRFSGDRELLDELFPTAYAYLTRWAPRYADADGILAREGWHEMWDWVDWEGMRESMAPMNFFYYGALHDLASAAQALGKEAEHIELQMRMEALRQALWRRFWSEQYCAYVDCWLPDDAGGLTPFISEHTLSLALRYGLVPAQYVAAVLDRLTDGSVPHASLLHKVQKYWALGEHGRTEAILSEMRAKWLRMGSLEATGTCQEVWEAEPESGFAHCHSAATAPLHILAAYVLGVRPTQPAFDEFIVQPAPCDLRYAQGTVPTPHGDVSVRWEATPKGLHMDVAVPDGYTLVEKTATLQRYRFSGPA